MRIIALIMCFCNYVSSSVKDQIAGEDYLEKKKKKTALRRHNYRK